MSLHLFEWTRRIACRSTSCIKSNSQFMTARELAFQNHTLSRPRGIIQSLRLLSNVRQAAVFICLLTCVHPGHNSTFFNCTFLMEVATCQYFLFLKFLLRTLMGILRLYRSKRSLFACLFRHCERNNSILKSHHTPASIEYH